jgi:DNA-binding NarL/FixJ family response regulator
VKVYLHAIFEKLGVGNRTELAIRADEFLAG